MMLLALKLLIAHVLGDFVLQPSKWVAAKKKHGLRTQYFYFHGLVHLLTLLLLLQFQWSLWFIILTIVISHLGIDYIKIKLEGRLNDRLLFVGDQIAHLLVIALMVHFQYPFQLSFEPLYSSEALLLLLSILGITYVSAILMKTIMGKWDLAEDKSEDSLADAGKYIGILERIFVFTFILLNQWGAIGLLIAAKSVFRFGDLSRAKDRKLTEYILIGTLLSFALAIFIGLGYLYLSKII